MIDSCTQTPLKARSQTNIWSWFTWTFYCIRQRHCFSRSRMALIASSKVSDQSCTFTDDKMATYKSTVQAHARPQLLPAIQKKAVKMCRSGRRPCSCHAANRPPAPPRLTSPAPILSLNSSGWSILWPSCVKFLSNYQPFRGARTKPVSTKSAGSCHCGAFCPTVEVQVLSSQH